MRIFIAKEIAVKKNSEIKPQCEWKSSAVMIGTRASMINAIALMTEAISQTVKRTTP